MLQSKGVATPFDLHGLHLVHWQKLENKTDCMNTNEPPNFISGITFLNTIELTKLLNVSLTAQTSNND